MHILKLLKARVRSDNVAIVQANFIVSALVVTRLIVCVGYGS